MAEIKNVLKDFNVFFMGGSYAGRIEECNLPKLGLKTEDFRAAGMSVPLKMKMGANALDTDFTVVDFHPALSSSVSIRQRADVSFVFRGAYEDWNGKITARVVIMRGQVTNIDPGSATPGSIAKLKISMNLNYYSDAMDNVPVAEIDAINNIWMQNGVDVLTDVRDALGL